MVRGGGRFESEETLVERLYGIAELFGALVPTRARLEHLPEHQAMRLSHVQACGFATCE